MSIQNNDTSMTFEEFSQYIESLPVKIVLNNHTLKLYYCNPKHLEQLTIITKKIKAICFLDFVNNCQDHCLWMDISPTFDQQHEHKIVDFIKHELTLVGIPFV